MIDDDVAVKDSPYTAGRRGVGGTVMLEKIVGAAAERGDDLGASTPSPSGSSRTCGRWAWPSPRPTVPHVGEPSFDLADDGMEVGIGIHGEPGRARMPVENADAIVCAPARADRRGPAVRRPGTGCCCSRTRWARTPLLELYLAHGIAERLLAERGIVVERRLVGPYVTSLEMQGMSLTLLRLDDDLLELWDAPVRTAALRWGT